MGSIRHLKRRGDRGSYGGSRRRGPGNLLEAVAAMRGQSFLEVVQAMSVGSEDQTRLPSPDAPSVPWEQLLQVLEQLPTITELGNRPSRVRARLKTAEAMDLLAFTCDPLVGARNTLGALLFPWEDPTNRQLFPFALMGLRGRTCAVTLDDYEALMEEGGRHVFSFTIIQADLEPWSSAIES